MYFVTLCSHHRHCLFGEIVDTVMHPSVFGQIVIEEWMATASVRSEVILDEWILMPNHLHAIVAIVASLPRHDPFDWVGGEESLAHPQRRGRSLGALIAGFKSRTTARINTLRNSPGLPVWQRGYYDHIIRAESALENIRRYIVENPARWALDPDNPVNSPGLIREPG